MPKLTNICLLLAILSLCARLSLGCTTRPTIEHSTRPTWSPCFPDCEKGFQCQAAYLSGLAWVAKQAVLVWHWNFPQFSIQNLCASFKERIWKPQFEYQDQTNMASMEQARSNWVFLLPWLWKRTPMSNNRTYGSPLWHRVSGTFLSIEFLKCIIAGVYFLLFYCNDRTLFLQSPKLNVKRTTIIGIK